MLAPVRARAALGRQLERAIVRGWFRIVGVVRSIYGRRTRIQHLRDAANLGRFKYIERSDEVDLRAADRVRLTDRRQHARDMDDRRAVPTRVVNVVSPADISDAPFGPIEAR